MEAGAPKGRASDPALAHPPTLRWPRAPPACRPQLLPLPLPLCGDAACPVPVPNKKGSRDGLRVTCQLGRRWHATCVAWGTSTPEVHAVAVEQLGTGTVAEVQAQMEDEGLDEAMADLEQGQHADAPAQRRRLRSQSCQSRTKKRQRILRQPRSRSWSWRSRKRRALVRQQRRRLRSTWSAPWKWQRRSWTCGDATRAMPRDFFFRGNR